MPDVFFVTGTTRPTFLGATWHLETWATYGRAKLLVETADFDEARLALEAVIERTTDSPRMRAGAWIWLSIGALRAGHHRLAETAARRALETHATPAIRLPALAALARALVAQAPRSEEAFELARDLQAQEAARRGLGVDDRAGGRAHTP